MDEVYTFAVDDEIVASCRLRPASRGHPYVGILGDYLGEMRDVTGVDASRVLGKVRKAYAKFKVCPNDDAVGCMWSSRGRGLWDVDAIRVACLREGCTPGSADLSSLAAWRVAVSSAATTSPCSRTLAVRCRCLT